MERGTNLDLMSAVRHLRPIDAALPREQLPFAPLNGTAHSTVKIPKTPITQGSDDRRMSRPVAP